MEKAIETGKLIGGFIKYLDSQIKQVFNNELFNY